VIHAIAPIVYFLCAATAAACATLLLNGYARNRVALLFWSGLCFIGLTLNNVALILDRLVFPELDLWWLRLGPAVLGVCALVYGLIVESDG
jgi:hypothetical protein